MNFGSTILSMRLKVYQPDSGLSVLGLLGSFISEMKLVLLVKGHISDIIQLSDSSVDEDLVNNHFARESFIGSYSYALFLIQFSAQLKYELWQWATPDTPS